MQPPILSCLCVTYNRPEFYEFLLWNFKKQTSKNIELLVVDGSTKSYADQFQHKNVRYMYLRDQPNIPIKRNIAMDNARAPYIAWFDDDDWQHAKRCELLLEQLKKGAMLAGCSSSFFYSVHDGSIKNYSGTRILFNSMGVERDVACATRFREDCLKASDNEWCRQIYSKTSNKTALLKSDTLFFWLSHGKNISNSSTKIRAGRGEATKGRLAELLNGEREPFITLMQQITDSNSVAAPVNTIKRAKTAKPASENDRKAFKACISVVVAIRNRSGYRVQNFLKTLRAQTNITGNIEIILVDSSSSQDHFLSLWNLAKKYHSTLIRLDEDHTWNKPLALNVGIKASTQDYVFLTDIDMIFQNDFISTALKKLTSCKGNVVLHCQSRDLTAHAITATTNVIERFDNLKQQSRWHSRFGTGACFITKKKWLHKVHGLDEAYSQWGAMDRDISKRAEWDGVPIVWLEEETTFLHQWHVDKQALWRENPAIREIWNENHRRFKKYVNAAEKNHTLPDQIVRNPESWGGGLSSSVFLENGEELKPLSQFKAEKAENGLADEPADIQFAQTNSQLASAAGKRLPAVHFEGKVALAFNTCPADAYSLEFIVPHVVKQCGYAFDKKLLFSDRSGLSGKYLGKHRFDVDKYDSVLRQLRNHRHIDGVYECDGLRDKIRTLLAGNFDTKSYNGSPTLSYLASMLLPKADYILRLDSDILFYRRPGIDWITEGIRQMEADERILFFMATPGPYSASLRRMRSFRRDVQYTGNYFHYSSVTTRYFLFKKSRFEEYCKKRFVPASQRLEIALSNLCAANDLRRICMHSPDVWHLHTNAAEWSARNPLALDKLINCVEKNDIPDGQIGEYDLTGRWLNELVLNV